ncbi:ABC transporter permease [Zavarzinia sp.]|uniref:ABC transporter permease n=1 Tax=Zavarzinia sp. TaxID=2027920 RepID=UPI003564F024
MTAGGVKGALGRGLSFLALLALWQAAALALHSAELPSPLVVAGFAVDQALHGDLLAQLAATLRRVVISFAVAMAIGCAGGIALGLSRRLDALFETWLLVLLNLPALVIAILCYIWLGLTEAAAIVAVALNKIPNVVVILREGTRAIDPGLEEMRRAFRLSPAAWGRHVLLPQLAPFVAAAARSGLALVWKIVLLVELLGRGDGIGYAISTRFQLFDVRGVLGYAFAFTLVMLVVEYLVLQPLEAHAGRWRPAPARA